jgi:hypothetical protein
MRAAGGVRVLIAVITIIDRAPINAGLSPQAVVKR